MLSSSSHEVKNITGVTQPSLRSFSHTLKPSPSGKYTSKRYKSVFSLSILLKLLISALSITSYPLSRRSCDNCPLITSSSSNIYTLGSLVINFDNLTIKKAGKDIQLSPTEFALLEILVCNRCLIVRREVFFQKLWDRTGTFVEDNTLTVTVSRLKTKLGKMDNSDKNYIDTIRGVGYRWRER